MSQLHLNRMELQHPRAIVDTTILSSAKKHSRGLQMTSSDTRDPGGAFGKATGPRLCCCKSRSQSEALKASSSVDVLFFLNTECPALTQCLSYIYLLIYEPCKGLLVLAKLSVPVRSKSSKYK